MPIIDVHKSKKSTAAASLKPALFLKKIKKSSTTVRNEHSSTDTDFTVKSNPISIGNRIQSLMTIVTRKDSTAKQSKYAGMKISSSTSLCAMPSTSPDRSKCSNRPLSQFFFSTKSNMTEDSIDGELMVEAASMIRSSNHIEKRSQQQQQTKQRQFKRLSLGLDFDQQQEKPFSLAPSEKGTSSNSSSRSSSLKTIRNYYIDNQLPEEENHISLQTNEIGMQSDITFACSTSSSQSSNKDRHWSTFSYAKEKRLSSVARARTVFGFGSLRSKESRAIGVWRNTVSQLLSEPNNNFKAEVIEENSHYQELYRIITHPALITEEVLEQQRFVQQSSPKNLAMVKFILNELSETEKSYNQLLKLIQNRYMKPMILASQSKYPLVKATDIPLLFSHLPELIELSDKLLDQFKSTNNVGLVFRTIEENLVVFLKYSMHYKSNMKLIRRACSNVLFVKINQENLSRKDTNRLGMSDYLIAPIQRIPRYCLLLKDLQKYTHPSESHKIDLNYALKVLTGLAVAMDHVQSNNKAVALQPRVLP
ncbi:Dbl homology domain-containing protein [Blakeslea trispora]|nr:Dbl homology domain-containing protein [Blakeslea trispora]